MAEFKTFITQLVNITQSKIAYLQTFSQLSNEEKKAKLDDFITAWAETQVKNLPLNMFERWIINKFLIKNIPTVTQLVFDLLKNFVVGLTKVKEV